MIIAAIIPCFKVRKQIIAVVQSALEHCDHVFVIDDNCPENSGQFVEDFGFPQSVKVIRHPRNLGVGGAVATGYKAALAANCDIMVKVDGDGQMPPSLIPNIVKPILAGNADYVKGNRFFNIDDLSQMPKIRLFGNAILSFVSKFSSGYWDVMDPTNGFTAIHKSALKQLPLDKLAKRYFFESDMLFRLNLIGAVVKDMPMPSRYADENSSLNIRRVLFEFPVLYVRNFAKRFLYSYILRDFNAASVEALLGAILFLFGLTFGIISWVSYAWEAQAAPVGTIMVATLPVILGTQFLLAALAFDVASVPKRPIQRTDT